MTDEEIRKMVERHRPEIAREVWAQVYATVYTREAQLAASYREMFAGEPPACPEFYAVARADAAVRGIQ